MPLTEAQFRKLIEFETVENARERYKQKYQADIPEATLHAIVDTVLVNNKAKAVFDEYVRARRTDLGKRTFLISINVGALVAALAHSSNTDYKAPMGFAFVFGLNAIALVVAAVSRK